MSFKETRVPVELILPYLREYLDKYETNDVYRETSKAGVQMNGGNTALSPARILAEESGLHFDTLRRLWHGCKARPIATLSFTDADALLCAMGRSDLWLVEPLYSVYMSIDMQWLDEHHPVVEADDNVRRIAA